MSNSPIEPDVIKLQTKTIKLAIDIGDKEMAELGARLNAKKFEERTFEDQKKILREEGAYLYLKNFWTLLAFICTSMENGNPDDSHFLIPSIRELTELYAELLFFLNQDTRTTIGVFVGNYLLHYSDYYRFFSPSEALKSEYERYHALAKPILDSEEIAFSSEVDGLSHKRLKVDGFNFPSYEEIFKQSYFSELSKETFACWTKDNATTFYNKYYRVHSSYAHRGFMNQVNGTTGTEAFWIIQFLYMISQLTLELSSAKIFDGGYQAEYRAFFMKIGEAYPKLSKDWDSRKTDSPILK
jgi:hypothetical protein